MINTVISHYRILQKLGEGGMGEVYLAEDTKLDRKVALKFLPKEFTQDKDARERFKREAKAAAALNHPNIVTIYEINEHEDQTYIAMEYVEGLTLKEKITSRPLPLTEVTEITAQICEGLKAAHKAGIIHRDIKPHNIIIDKEDRIKILDFGLAKLKGVSQLTKESSTLGTVNYLSPEQALGKEVDQRTDIWSLGAILYEMLTGQLPFKGDYEQAVVYSIINEEPEPVSDKRSDTPKELKAIINKTLAKDPSKRYQQVDDLIAGLKQVKMDPKPEKLISPKRKPKTMVLGTLLIAAIIIAVYFIFTGLQTKKPPDKTIGKTQWKNSVAVLPFRDFSPQKDQEYFCDGMTDALIGKLSQLKQLKIISLTSVLQYKNQARNIKKIGKELDVETILEGSIQKEGNHIRVNAQLIHVADDSHIWQNTYDRELKSLFSIQDEITGSIVNALRIELLKEEKSLLSKHHTQNMDAYKLYMQGRFFWRRRSREGYEKSLDFYQQALKIDPDYALAYSGLSDSLSVLAWNRYISLDEGFARANKAARRALELNDQLAEAHTSLAYILLDHEWQFEAARREFERAIQLNPGYATAYQWYARYYVYHGDMKKAMSLLKQAHQLDPLAPSIHNYLAAIYAWAGDSDQAISLLKKGLDQHPDSSLLHDMLGLIYCEKSMFAEALDEFKKLSEPLPYTQKYYSLYVDLKRGNREALLKSQRIITQWEAKGKAERIFPMQIAILFGLAGKTNKYFEWLEYAYEWRDPQILNLKVYPLLPQYRSDPRFKALLKKIGLDQ